jgi:hypothetical protein
MLWAMIIYIRDGKLWPISQGRQLMAYFFLTVAVVGFTGGVTFAWSLFVGQMMPGIIGLITCNDNVIIVVVI